MSRRQWISIAAAVVLGGCITLKQQQQQQVVAPPPAPAAPGQPTYSPYFETCTCPDHTTDCCPPNGTGVYTAEEGKAGIGRYKLMITHFISHGSSVTFEGRYFDPESQGWRKLASPTPGRVDSAEYQGKHLRVTAVQEASTAPTWTLLDPATQKSFPVTDTQLLHLKLYISFDVSSATTPPRPPPQTPRATASQGPGDPAIAGSERYVLDFDHAGTDGGQHDVHTYNLRWSEAIAGAQPTQYCVDANGFADPIVFQQGIDVVPTTGAVTHTANTSSIVTMSCRKGALATVYWWGYDYDTSDPFYFSAGIQMKRASYCGDYRHYTYAGTNIYIADAKGIHTLPDQDLDNIEAAWGPGGALCINLDERRHWGITYDGAAFDGTCNGQKLPVCRSRPLGKPYLIDRPVHPQP